MRAAVVVAIVLAPALAACLAPVDPPIEPADDDAATSLPVGPWAPNPKIGPQPALRADTRFVETEWGFVDRAFAPPAEPMPVRLLMDGYEGAGYLGVPSHYLRLRDGTYLALNVADGEEGWLVAFASLRGTGCSGGTLNLFDRTSALDGREAIEFLARENWTGPIGMRGASYSALTAFLVASTQPPSLGALAISATVSDIYRDVVYPGGILNNVFPVLWPTALRPRSELAGNVPTLAAGDEICAFNVATRDPASPGDNVYLNLLRTEDGPWYQASSTLTYAKDVRVPTLFTVAWQDDQLSARMVQLFVEMEPDVPRRLEATNGWHFTSHALLESLTNEWFEETLLGIDHGLVSAPPVRVHFGGTRLPEYADQGTLDLDAFPATTTEWTRLHLRADGALTADPPTGAEEPDRYLAVPGRHASVVDPSVYADVSSTEPDARGPALPDALAYATEPFEEAVVVAGPIAATLHLATTATDTDLVVEVVDVYPDGSRTFLQRGLLRASHRALDPARSWTNDAGDLVRPYHPHSNPEPVAPGAIERYDVEVMPLGHVLYPGHRLELRVHAPAVADGFWGYATARAAPVNSVYHDAERPSSILLPVVPWAGGPLPPEPACGAPDAYGCVPP